MIEGGGMKAAYANGVLTAFENASYNPWDAVIGTSAGGALAAWYGAGQAAYAEGTWAYANDARILSYKRAFTGRGPLLDHEALLEIVYREEHPLDVEALRQAPWPVIVTVVDVETGEMLYADLRKQDDPVEWIKATGRLPFGSGPPVTIAGQDLLDGGVYDPIPVRYAVETLGATDVTLILNTPLGPKKRADPKVLLEVAARRYPALRRGIMEHQQIKQEAVRYALDPPPGVEVHIIAPAEPTGLSRLSRDDERLAAAMELGHSDGSAHVDRAISAGPTVRRRPSRRSAAPGV